MIHEATATGETVEIAAANAIKMLAAPLEAEVKTEILEIPKKKVLGLFGGAPAKVRAYYEAPDAPKEAVKAKPAPKAAPAPTAKKPQPVAKKAEAPKAQQPQAKPEEVTAEPERQKIEIDASKPGLQAARDYLVQIISLMGAEKVDIEAFRLADGEVLLEIDCGDDYGLVIGRRGETLDSIQYLTRLTANKKKSEGEYTRVSVNVGNYR